MGKWVFISLLSPFLVSIINGSLTIQSNSSTSIRQPGIDQIRTTRMEINLGILCPTLAKHLYPYYRFDNISGNCFRAGDRRPCRKNMIFYSEENSSLYGSCDCDYANEDRELVYHCATQQCHYVYSQAYCAIDAWLIFNGSGSPNCEPNPCYQSKSNDESIELVRYQGRCVPLGSDCGDEKVVDFVRGNTMPQCTVPRKRGFALLTIGVPKLRCNRGSFRSITGKCRPKLVFDPEG